MKDLLTYEEFAEKFMDENSDLCSCHTTTMPPCAFCEGAFVKDAYEEYVDEIREENIND